MNWDTMGLWVDRDQPLDAALCAGHAIGIPLFDSRSGNAKQQVAVAQGAHLDAGLYFAVDHYPGANPTAAAFARWASTQLNAIAPRKGAEAPPAMLDLEGVSRQWIADCLVEYRKHQPARPTSFTDAPGQNETVVPVEVLAATNMHWYVQLYGGDMTPVADPAATILEVARIYDPAKVHAFYDGARLPALPYDVTDGCIFTQQRLPRV